MVGHARQTGLTRRQRAWNLVITRTGSGACANPNETFCDTWRSRTCPGFEDRGWRLEARLRVFRDVSSPAWKGLYYTQSKITYSHVEHGIRITVDFPVRPRGVLGRQRPVDLLIVIVRDASTWSPGEIESRRQSQKLRSFEAPFSQIGRAHV